MEAKRTFRSIPFGAVLALAGCSIPMDVPSTFIVLDERPSEIRAMSADGARLSVLELGDAKKGDLGFWTEALKNDFKDNRGYVLVEERKVKDGAGREGSESVWETTLDGTAQRYLAALFVIDDSVRMVEYLAPKEVFEKHLEEVRKAVGTLR